MEDQQQGTIRFVAPIMTTVSVNFEDIPSFLREGSFYANLDIDDPSKNIEIDGNYKVDGDTAVTLDEFTKLLRVMDFWGLKSIPSGVVLFCLQHERNVWYAAAAEVLHHTGQQDILQKLVSCCVNDGILDFVEVMKSDRWDIIYPTIEYVRDVCKDCSIATLLAAREGNLPVLMVLHENSFPWHQKTCAMASAYGHLPCLQYAYENGCPWDFNVHFAAAEYGHQSCMQYAYENGCPWYEQTLFVAANMGHLECLTYALRNDCPHDRRACEAAACRGHLACLQRLFEHGVPCTVDTATQAALCPDVACLQFLHEHECPWDQDTLITAAFHGNMNTLIYAMSQNCPYGNSLIEAAVLGGHFECIFYLVDAHSVTLNNSVFIAALLRGELHNLEYLLDVGCPYVNAQFKCPELIWQLLNDTFNEHKFLECVKYAVLERGWNIDLDYVDFVDAKGLSSCVEFVNIERPDIARLNSVTGMKETIYLPQSTMEMYMLYVIFLFTELCKCAAFVFVASCALTLVGLEFEWGHFVRIVSLLFGFHLLIGPKFSSKFR